MEKITEKKHDGITGKVKEDVTDTSKKNPNTLETICDEKIKDLQNKLQLLSEENENLKIEIQVTKENNAKIIAQSEELKKLPMTDNATEEIKTNIIKIFNELQTNHLKLKNNFIIYPVAFMNRLLQFFPFLQKYKKY